MKSQELFTVIQKPGGEEPEKKLFRVRIPKVMPKRKDEIAYRSFPHAVGAERIEANMKKQEGIKPKVSQDKNNFGLAYMTESGVETGKVKPVKSMLKKWLLKAFKTNEQANIRNPPINRMNFNLKRDKQLKSNPYKFSQNFEKVRSSFNKTCHSKPVSVNTPSENNYYKTIEPPRPKSNLKRERSARSLFTDKSKKVTFSTTNEIFFIKPKKTKLRTPNPNRPCPKKKLLQKSDNSLAQYFYKS